MKKLKNNKALSKKLGAFFIFSINTIIFIETMKIKNRSCIIRA